jgi:hypothetical protein
MMNNLYTGCVENRNDPLKLGRCQVRIVGLHTESKVTLPTEDLPWAYPMQPITSAGTSGVGSAPLGPVEGSWVLVVFMDPDQQMPMMLGTLAGAYQTPDALSTGKFQIDEADAAGNIVLTNVPQQQNADGTPVTPPPTGGAADAGSSQGGETTVKDGKVVTDPAKIVGPLGTLVAKAESGRDGYNAFNRGTANGKIIPAGKKMDLTKMSIKDIMARQTLPAGDPERLFAVGKYQCIPVTLKSACQALNIDINEPFSELTQDIICQEYLVGKKRPALISYYRNPDKNNQDLLLKAGQSLAAEFASIEDPYFPGFPYKGEGGTYYKSGNRAKTLWERDIKPALFKEWDFRNNKEEPPVTAKIADNDKVEKGTDFSGVSKATPVDDSVATPPKSSAAAPVAQDPVLPDIPALPALPAIPGADALAGITGSLTSALGDITSAIGGALDGLDLDLDIDSLFSSLGSLGADASDLLKQFGGNINEIASNLGIENVTGSVSELSNNLGLYNASQTDVVKELAKKAGSTQGQAAALLAKLDTPEPTKPEVAPAGTANADGTISNGTGVDPNKGFQDPNGTYPKYKNEPDTNRLATGNNIGRTIVLKKEATLKTGIKIANGGTWDQSPNPYNATYPYNKVTQTESGHVEEWDDTPGSERIHTYHKSGTFSEIDANGTQVNRIVGDGFQVMERNGFIYVKGAYCVTVDGAMNLRTDNVFNLEVSGAANIFVYNEANINVSKDCNLAVGATLNAKANTINLESEKQFNIRAGTGLNIQAGMDINFKSDASINTQALANISNKATGAIFSQAEGDINQKATVVNIESSDSTNVKSGSSLNIESADDTNIKSGASIKQESGGKLSLKAGGDLSADAGGIVDIANGSSESADAAESAEDAIDARDASFAELELPVETRGTSGVDRLPPMAVSTRGSEVGLDAPDGQGSATDSGAGGYQSNRVENNQTSQSAVEGTKFEKSKEVPKATSASTPGEVAGLDAIRNMPADQFTAGMKLSKHFTLGDLTKGGVRIPRVTYTDKNGIQHTPQQIVSNLKNLAVNALDPIYEKYGKFTITSAFRRGPFGAAPGDLGVSKATGKPIQEGGDHIAGCAADIVFPGGKQETFNRAKEIAELLKSWNQIIMEYDGNAYWIHVAVRPTSNKGDMFTMVAHKTYQGTFPKGGFVLV